jgi:hypothetical protein
MCLRAATCTVLRDSDRRSAVVVPHVRDGSAGKMGAGINSAIFPCLEDVLDRRCGDCDVYCRPIHGSHLPAVARLGAASCLSGYGMGQSSASELLSAVARIPNCLSGGYAVTVGSGSWGQWVGEQETKRVVSASLRTFDDAAAVDGVLVIAVSQMLCAAHLSRALAVVGVALATRTSSQLAHVGASCGRSHGVHSGSPSRTGGCQTTNADGVERLHGVGVGFGTVRSRAVAAASRLVHSLAGVL